MASPYTTLPTPQSFRLLRLAPCETRDALHGTLEIHSVDSHPPYESLSYSWGPGKKAYSMIFEGSVFDISESVILALWRLRHPTEPRLLWIDALCINQEDHEERAAQVLLMSQIYSNATCVLCYIGEDDEEGGEDSGMVIDFIQQIGRADFSRLPGLDISPEFMQQQGLPARLHVMWVRLKLFFERDWFRRCWVVQEFIAGAECTMIFGRAEVSWKTLRPGFEKMLEYGLLSWGLGPQYPVAESQLAHVSMSIFRMMLELKSMSSWKDMYGNIVRSFSSRDETAQRELVEGSWNDIVPGTKQLVETIRADPESSDFIMGIMEPLMSGIFSVMGLDDRTRLKLPLLKLHFFFMTSIATDPRDKLFALLSMSSENNEPELRPDYTEPIEQTFIRYAKFFLRTYPHNFASSVLLQAGWRHDRDLYDSPDTRHDPVNLPSWVPDFATTIIPAAPFALTTPAGTKFGYKASGATSLDIGFDDDDQSVLHIKGSRLGLITRIVPPLDLENLSNDDPGGDFVNYFDRIDSLFLLRAERYEWTPAETATDVLWRTLIANVGDRPFLVEESYGKLYAQVREEVEAMRCGEFSMMDLPRFESFLRLPWAKRWVVLNGAFAACETDTGLLGLVPKTSRVGDEVCLFLGGHMPFVLRDVDREKGTHELFGGCYMHGIMQGEAVEAKGWKLEEFRLR